MEDGEEGEGGFQGVLKVLQRTTAGELRNMAKQH
jgi:hypothetical protein